MFFFFFFFFFFFCQMVCCFSFGDLELLILKKYLYNGLSVSFPVEPSNVTFVCRINQVFDIGRLQVIKRNWYWSCRCPCLSHILLFARLPMDLCTILTSLAPIHAYGICRIEIFDLLILWSLPFHLLYLSSFCAFYQCAFSLMKNILYTQKCCFFGPVLSLIIFQQFRQLSVTPLFRA